MGHIHLILAALVFVRGRECVYVCVGAWLRCVSNARHLKTRRAKVIENVNGWG